MSVIIIAVILTMKKMFTCLLTCLSQRCVNMLVLQRLKDENGISSVIRPAKVDQVPEDSLIHIKLNSIQFKTQRIAMTGE